MTVSVLILTYNEERNIADCLDSVGWCDDIVVLDSGSTDRTVDIARDRGARVAQRRFDNYASQRNFGLTEIQYRNSWVLMLDADERVPSELQHELVGAVATAPPRVCMFRLRRRDYLYGRWIKRSSGYPTWFGRVARLGSVRVERPINEEYKTEGDIRTLRGHLDHYPFNKGFQDWIIKHDRYSTMEASLLAAAIPPAWRWRDLVSSDPVGRRRAVKTLVYSLPLRPALIFFALYIARGGVLEGQAGLTFSLLRAWYEFLIDCKCRELRRRARGLAV